MQREHDSECCNIYYEAPSRLICTETLYIHRLWLSPGAFCSICSYRSTAPSECTCSPPHTCTSDLTCLCSSEAPSNENLGQKNKNDTRLIITHAKMMRWHTCFRFIAETQKWQKTWSNRKNVPQFLYLVCSLWNRGCMCLPGSARWWNFLQDRRRTLCKTSDTHLAEESRKAKWGLGDSMHGNEGCGYATLSCLVFFLWKKKKRAVLQKQLFSVLFSYTDSTVIIHFKRWVNALWKTTKHKRHRNIKKREPFSYPQDTFYTFCCWKWGPAAPLPVNTHARLEKKLIQMLCL